MVGGDCAGFSLVWGVCFRAPAEERRKTLKVTRGMGLAIGILLALVIFSWITTCRLGAKVNTLAEENKKLENRAVVAEADSALARARAERAERLLVAQGKVVPTPLPTPTPKSPITLPTSQPQPSKSPIRWVVGIVVALVIIAGAIYYLRSRRFHLRRIRHKWL